MSLRGGVGENPGVDVVVDSPGTLKQRTLRGKDSTGTTLVRTRHSITSSGVSRGPEILESEVDIRILSDGKFGATGVTCLR